MKRFYKHVGDNGVVTIATISIEAESVTITRKESGSRSKGKPTRVPVKLCRDGSTEQEARLRGAALMEEGFAFDREEATGSQFAMVGSQYYWRLNKAEARQLIELLCDSHDVPGLSARRSTHDMVLVDAEQRELKISAIQGVKTLLMPGTPFLAVAFVAASKGIGSLVKDVDGTAAQAVGARDVYIESLSMGTELQQYMADAGVSAPGVIRPTCVQHEAVLI